MSTVTRAEAAFRTWDRRRVAATGTAAIWHESADEDRAVHRAALALFDHSPAEVAAALARWCETRP